MWIIAEYQPTTLFSLRPYTSTTSGGKSLIVPTPFAVKMALLDVAIRTQGLDRGQMLFPALRDLQIAVRLPRWIVVNNSFTKVWRINDGVAKQGKAEKARLIAEARAKHKWPYQASIGFREYVQFAGPLELAFQVTPPEELFQMMPPEELMRLLLQINYLGKRGGFVQLLRRPETVESLPDDFSALTEGVHGDFLLGMLQIVDDCGPELTFERTNIYSDEPIRPGKDRIFHHVVLPYRPARSSRGFTLYERMGSSG